MHSISAWVFPIFHDSNPNFYRSRSLQTNFFALCLSIFPRFTDLLEGESLYLLIYPPSTKRLGVFIVPCVPQTIPEFQEMLEPLWHLEGQLARLAELQWTLLSMADIRVAAENMGRSIQQLDTTKWRALQFRQAFFGLS